MGPDAPAGRPPQRPLHRCLRLWSARPADTAAACPPRERGSASATHSSVAGCAAVAEAQGWLMSLLLPSPSRSAINGRWQGLQHVSIDWLKRRLPTEQSNLKQLKGPHSPCLPARQNSGPSLKGFVSLQQLELFLCWHMGRQHHLQINFMLNIIEGQSATGKCCGGSLLQQTELLVLRQCRLYRSMERGSKGAKEQRRE